MRCLVNTTRGGDTYRVGTCDMPMWDSPFCGWFYFAGLFCNATCEFLLRVSALWMTGTMEVLLQLPLMDGGQIVRRNEEVLCLPR